MAPARALIVRGMYLPREQIQQITLSTGSVPLTAAIRLYDGTEYRYVGEEAESVRAQSEGLSVVIAPLTQRSPTDVPEFPSSKLDDEHL